MSDETGIRPDRQKGGRPTRTHILEVAAQMLRESDKEHFRIAELVERANVGVPTVYYYFASLDELVAHAQILNYVESSRTIHSYDDEIRRSFEELDADLFYDSIYKLVQAQWHAGGFDGSLGIARLFTDIWADDGARAALRAIMRERVQHWTPLAHRAQELGWISPAQDAEFLLLAVWAAALGHGILGDEFDVVDGDERMAAFTIRAMRHAGPVERSEDTADAEDDGAS